MIFEINYSSENGATELHGIKIKFQSPKGSLRLTREGNANELTNELKELEQDVKENESQTRRCDKINVNDLFALCNQLGADILGTKEEKYALLTTLGIDTEIQDVTEILNDDCGAEIWTVALFRDSKYYYNLQCVRNWPNYEP